MAKAFKLFTKGIILRPIDSGPNSCACDLSDTVEGSLWTFSCEFKGYLGAGIKTFVTQDECNVVVNTILVKDTQFTIQDNTTASKKAVFEASGISACATRTLTIPDKNITLAGTICESFTGTTTIATLCVTGNITVGGTTTTLNTATLDVEDPNMGLNKGGTEATADCAVSGITVQMSDACDARLGYDSTLTSKFKAGVSGLESEIIVAAGAQTITGNKTLSGCNVLSGKISGGTIDGCVTITATCGSISLPTSAASTEGQVYYCTTEDKVYYRNATENLPVDNESASFQITQACHGLAVTNHIYHTVACGWVKAQAHRSDTLPTYVVSKVSGSTFTAHKFGKVNSPCHGLTAGQYYFADVCTAGAINLCSPAFGYSAPILYVEDACNWHAILYRPSLIACGIASDSEIGSVVAFGIPHACPPTGFLAANGASVSRTTYGCLFAKIGTAYGTADACSFNLPDLRGKFMRGQDNATGNDPGAACRTAHATGGNTGDNVGSIQGCAICCHAHADTFSNATTSFTAYVTCGGASSGFVRTTTGSCGSATGCHTHCQNGAVTTVTGACVGETRPLNVSVNYFIRYSPKGAILGVCSSTSTAVKLVTTEAELNTALTNAICGCCTDIIIGGSFNLTTQKEIPSNTTVRQNTNSFLLTAIGGACGLTEGVQEVSTITFASAPCFATSDFDNKQVLINAPRLGTDQAYYIWFDDSVCCTDTDPALTGTGIQVCTNGDTTNTLIATGTAAAINCHVSAGLDFTATSCGAVVTITSNRAGDVTNSSVCGIPDTKLKRIEACGGASNESFGTDISISCCYMIVGANNEDRPCLSNAGAAYIFKKNLGACCCVCPCNWGELKKIVACCPATNDNFARSVSICGCYAVIGNDACENAIIYKKDQGGTDNWGILKTIVACDAACDSFGWDVDVNGCYIAVGAKNKTSATGAAYIFKQCSGGADNWGQIKKVTSSVGETGDCFGNTVAIHSCRLIVGANNEAVCCVCCCLYNEGVAYIYERNSGGCCNWGQVKRIQSPNAGAAGTTDWSESIDICGCFAAISAQCFGNGIVYIYKKDQGGCCNWGSVASLIGTCIPCAAIFGSSLSLDGCNLAVGDIYHLPCGVGNGAVLIYGRNTGGACSWGNITTVRNACSDAAADNFGGSVSLCGNRLAIGAPFEGDACEAARGYAYIYKPGNVSSTTSTAGVEPSAMFNFAACVSKSKLDGINLTTTSNGLTAVEVQNLATKNRINGLSVTTGSAPIAPVITIDGQKNIIAQNEIDTCSSCTDFTLIEQDGNATGNVVSDNIED